VRKSTTTKDETEQTGKASTPVKSPEKKEHRKRKKEKAKWG